MSAKGRMVGTHTCTFYDNRSNMSEYLRQVGENENNQILRIIVEIIIYVSFILI